MLEYEVTAHRQDAHGSLAMCKEARIALDTDLAGRPDAFNPAELLLAALAACILKNIERVAPIIHFDFRGIEVRVHGLRQDAPPRMTRIDYVVEIDTDEPDTRLELLHQNVQRHGTVFNTLSGGTELAGILRRGARAAGEGR